MDHASIIGDENQVRVLLQAGIDPDVKDACGCTALCWASNCGHEGIVRLLLGAAAAVDAECGVRGTALICASKYGHEALVRLLLEADAAVDLKDEVGTALMYASNYGLEGIVRLLLGAAASVDAECGDMGTALMCASQHGHEVVVRLLLEADAAVDLKDDVGFTALSYASNYGLEGIVRLLLGAGAAVVGENTALIRAIEAGHEGVVRLLLGAVAAVDVADQSGVTALMVAIRCGKLDVARTLLEAGAKLPHIGQSHAPWEFRQLLALHRDSRAAETGRAGREAAEAAAAAAADALLAEEEADKSSAASRQAKAKRKKQRQKTKRAEAVLAPAQVGEPAPSGADPPSQSSESQPAGAAAPTGVDEGQGAVREQGHEDVSRVHEGCVSAGAGRRATHASGGADERSGQEEEQGGAVLTAPDPPPVVSVPAEEVLRALEAAGSDGQVGEGGFGKVVAAELPSLAARWGRVAVKSASGLQAADILLEVATLGLCGHRNVLRLLGYCDDARAPCMITPLMHGGSLDDRLLLSASALERLRRLGFEGDARLDWQRRLSALCDAARGLAHLHGERILHRDVKTANILLEGALRPLPVAHGLPLMVHRAVLSDVGLAKVREPSLGGATHATTHNLAFSTGFGDPALLNSNQHSEKTDAFGIGICVLMSLVSAPAAGLLKDHEEDVCEAFEDGTGPRFGRAHAAAGWPSDATRALADMVHRLSMARTRQRQPLAEALVQMEDLLGVTNGKEVRLGALRPLASPPGASTLPVREHAPDARAAASTPSEWWSGGELTWMVRKLELGDADAPRARKRERVTKAYDSMMVRLERAYARQGHVPLPADEQELRKIDLLAPRHFGRLNGLAHKLRQWWNAAKHQRDQWAHSPSDKEVQRLVKDVIAELDGLGW